MRRRHFLHRSRPLSIAEAVGEEVEVVVVKSVEVVTAKVVMEEPVRVMVMKPVAEMEDMRVVEVVMVEAVAEVEAKRYSVMMSEMADNMGMASPVPTPGGWSQGKEGNGEKHRPADEFPKHGQPLCILYLILHSPGQPGIVAVTHN